MSEEKPKVTTSRTFAVEAETTAKQLVSANPKRVGLLVTVADTGTAYIISARNMKHTDGIKITSSLPYSNDVSTNEYWIITESNTADVRVESVSE